MKKKEARLLHWHGMLSNRERKVECGEDSISNLMRECRIKDSLLAEKDLMIANKDKAIDEIVRENQGSVNEEVEVC